MDNASRSGARRRAAFMASVAALSLLTGWVFAAGAIAGESCSEAVLADWADDGRIEVTYDRGCYLDAIDDLPEDIRTYSSAEDDISRALQSRRTSAATTLDPDPVEAQAPTIASDTSDLRSVPTAIVLLSGAALVAGAAGLGSSALRRRRRIDHR